MAAFASQSDSYRLKTDAEPESYFAVRQNSASVSVLTTSDVNDVSIGCVPSLNSKSPSSFRTADTKIRLPEVDGRVRLPTNFVARRHNFA